MRRFSEVKHQRTMALAQDMNAAADEIVKLRNNVWQSKLDPAELRAEELRIREKRGLLEDTPVSTHCRPGFVVVWQRFSAPARMKSKYDGYRLIARKDAAGSPYGGDTRHLFEYPLCSSGRNTTASPSIWLRGPENQSSRCNFASFVAFDLLRLSGPPAQAAP
jgi:hypothetical protein